MNYYNIADSTYRAALKAPEITYRTMIQPLDHWENALCELYADIITSSPPQQTAQDGNGVRRNVTLALADTEGVYAPSKNSHFWYNRKFRLWEGIIVGDDTYWQAQGVYCTTSAELFSKVLTITAVDKYGLLSGELNTARCVTPFTTDIASGDIIVADLIRETLGLNTGYLPLDPIEPIIDEVYEHTVLYADITLSAGQYYGAVLTSLAQMYGADCYYDRNGRFNFRRKQVYDRPWWYIHQGYAWQFAEGSADIIEGVRRTTDLRAVNTVTVQTDNSEGITTSVTVRNISPECPISVQNVGEQYPDDAIVKIAVGDTTDVPAEEKCADYGKYLLCSYTARLCSESFQAAAIPHIDVGDLVQLHGEDRLITAISTDHGTHISQIETCSTALLPTEMEVIVHE